MILQGDVYSETLNLFTGLSVFMPDKLGERDNYKVVYLLHGLHGDNRTWLQNTMLPVFAKNTKAVFIMPEVGRSFYTDMKYGLKYYTYIGEELPAICKRTFNISVKREDTAVMGCSMGGYGALKLALTKPDKYGFCGAFAPACLFFNEILTGLQTEADAYAKTGPDAQAIVNDLRTIFGDDLRYTPADMILELAKAAEKAPLKQKIYAACVVDDELIKDARRFNAQISKTALDWTFEEMPGAHEWYFFNEALKRALQEWGVGGVV